MLKRYGVAAEVRFNKEKNPRGHTFSLDTYPRASLLHLLRCVQEPLYRKDPVDAASGEVKKVNFVKKVPGGPLEVLLHDAGKSFLSGSMFVHS
jgi:hypothetical protein